MHFGITSAIIYFVNQSANNDDCGLRERKRRITRTSICTAARTLTAERGLHGYTIEELCEQVGISRRTFFNYFPGKEDAVLGHGDSSLPEDLVQAFLEGAGRLPLLDALVEFSAEMGGRMAISREEYTQLFAVLQKEPQLLTKLFGDSADRDKEFAALIARREGMKPEDPRAEMASLIIRQISWKSTDAFFDPANTLSYREIVTSKIAAAVYLFSDASITTS